MNYKNIFGHYHEAREGEPSLAQIWDGRGMKREKVVIKGKELIQLTEPKKLYCKRGVTRATWQRNLKRLAKLTKSTK